jgi:hypothetical protein
MHVHPHTLACLLHVPTIFLFLLIFFTRQNMHHGTPAYCLALFLDFLFSPSVYGSWLVSYAHSHTHARTHFLFTTLFHPYTQKNILSSDTCTYVNQYIHTYSIPINMKQLKANQKEEETQSERARTPSHSQ